MQRMKVTRWRLCLSLGLLIVTGCSEPDSARVEVPEGGGELVAEALREPDLLARVESLARGLRALPPEALPGVRRAYSGTFFDLGDTELVLLAEWWARFDAPAALDWSHTEWRADTTQVRQAILRSWARQDPEAALRHAENERADDVRALWMDAVLSGWEESGQPGVFEFVRAMPRGQDRQRALAALARRKVLRDGVALAFDWAEALPEDDDKFKLQLLRRVGGAAAEVAPQLAAERAGRLASGPYAHGLLAYVGRPWAKRDGAAALRWLATLPPGHARNDAVSETYRIWLRWAPEDALRFMEGPARSDPALDPATALYAQALAADDGETAIGVALELQDEDLRWASVGRAWRIWWTEDEPAANAWFEAHAAEIPEFYRERIPVIPQAMRVLKQQKARAAAP
jgi:hypothetical protein